MIMNTFERGGDGSEQMQQVKKLMEPNEAYAYFVRLMEEYQYHAFEARWNALQIKALKKNIPDKTAVITKDFAMSMTLMLPGALQDEFYTPVQVALYNSVVLVRGEDKKISKFYLHGISNDKKHDRFAARKFDEQVYQWLVEQQEHVQTIHEISDCAPQQYHSTEAFHDAASVQKRYPFTVSRCVRW